jgi:Protein RETICULATA-related
LQQSLQYICRTCAGMQRYPDTCTLCLQVSRGLVGRMMADPAFVQKLLMEGIICTGSSLLWEAQQRGERFSRELDLVAINTLSLLAANVALVWCVDTSHHLVSCVPTLCCFSLSAGDSGL